jgi:hypothetical protein
MPLRNSVFFVISILCFASACNFPSNNQENTQAPLPEVSSLQDVFPIDLIFAEFYANVGGEATLGPPISPLIESGNIKLQYVEAGLMTYDPSAPPSDRFSFAPLGVMMGVAEPPVPNPGTPGIRYSNGHIIYQEFVPFYEELGGARFVGRPLTEARHNPEKRRIEQYFENFGFYRMENEPPGTVHLLAYGVYACDYRCRYRASSNSIPSMHGFLPEPFSSAAARLGLSFTGITLSEPRLAQDDNVEVIFENVVMVLRADRQEIPQEIQGMFQLWLPEVLLNFQSRSPGLAVSGSPQSWLPLVIQIDAEANGIRDTQLIPAAWLPLVFRDYSHVEPVWTLRPIARIVGMEVGTPGPRREDPLMEFIPVQGDLGFHVPTLFIAFLHQYGGILISGAPISEPVMVSQGIFRQCFENLCVDFDVNKPESERLSLAPLGKMYAEMFVHPEEGAPDAIDNSQVRIEVRKSANYIPVGGILDIQIRVTEDGDPLRNRELIVRLTLPDGETRTVLLEPTDENGYTNFSTPPIEAPNVTLIPFAICLQVSETQMECVDDQFLIWEFPK